MTNFTFVFSEIIPPQPSPLRSSSLYTIDPKFGFKESNGFFYRMGFSKTATFSGWLLILIGSVSFVGFLSAAVISKLLPLSDSPIISAIQNDR
jgi:hypothetical protein